MALLTKKRQAHGEEWEWPSRRAAPFELRCSRRQPNIISKLHQSSLRAVAASTAHLKRIEEIKGVQVGGQELIKNDMFENFREKTNERGLGR
ncbi:hypothetical protein G5I_02150 [Acromyrmex echinatior]|uniref:Uncharacterized protein n=1 Tax=Acromyrmex echinatior TaxID=103372 RepID=F4W9J8_ACREC|nr:hypothetical protein G5I_02150 [Acromyrmex echinatior]